MTRSDVLLDKAIIVLALVFGGGSLLLFVAGPLHVVSLGLGEVATLSWDAALSVAFFLQHSVMVRTPVRRRIARTFSEHRAGAVYAIASGVVLTLSLVLWQRSPAMVLSVQGPARWFLHALAVAASAGFVWGAVSLRSFDPFGVTAIRAHLRQIRLRPSSFTVRGAYRWVRHPLYSSILLLIWSTPDVTADGLLFNVLWTAWIVGGTVLEERDLVAELGEPYLEYRRAVPMLLPWHAPRRRRPASQP